MTANYSIDEVPASPEYILEVVRDWTTEVAAAVVDPSYPTFQTPFTEWLDLVYFDPPSAKHLRPWFNGTWGTDITPEEWADFDPDRATVGDYCRLAASRTRRPVIRPWRSPAGECFPAGAFLTVRSLLADAGADPNAITPSALLAPHHSRLEGISFRLSLLAPGRRPRFRYNYPLWVLLTACIGCVFWLSACVVGVILLALGQKATAFALAVATLAYTVVMSVLMRAARSPQVDPDHVRTFRDLSYALAGQQPRRQIQPSS